MKKRLLLFFMVLVSVILAACGSDSTSNEEGVQSDFGTNNNSTYSFNDQVIVDNDMYKMTLVDATKEDENDFRSMEIGFEFVNKSEVPLSVTANNLSMDDKMVDFMTYFFNEQIPAGKTADISLDVSYFEDYEYPEFTKNFEVDVTVFDDDKGEEIETHNVKGEIK